MPLTTHDNYATNIMLGQLKVLMIFIKKEQNTAFL
jgi:hypothetical protein